MSTRNRERRQAARKFLRLAAKTYCPQLDRFIGPHPPGTEVDIEPHFYYLAGDRLYGLHFDDDIRGFEWLGIRR